MGIPQQTLSGASFRFEDLRATRPYRYGQPRRMKNKGRVFPPCPECGAQRDADGRPSTRPITTYYANDGELPCYYVKCLHCGHMFDVAMMVLPAGARMSALDEGIRLKRRDQARRRHGYVAHDDTQSRGGKRFSSDRIRATIRVVLGKTAKTQRWRAPGGKELVSYVGWREHPLEEEESLSA